MQILYRRLMTPWLRSVFIPFIDRIEQRLTVVDGLWRSIKSEDFDSDAVLEYDSDHENEEVFVQWQDMMHLNVWNELQSMVQKERKLLFGHSLSGSLSKSFKTK